MARQLRLEFEEARCTLIRRGAMSDWKQVPSVTIDWVMKFTRFWSFSIEILLKLYFPFVKKIALNPPFSKGEFTHRGAFPLFEKEGSGEILGNCALKYEI